jgi:hypothetical protein
MQRRFIFLCLVIGVFTAVTILFGSTAAFDLASPVPVQAAQAVPTGSASAYVKILPGILSLSSNEVSFQDLLLTGDPVLSEPVANIMLITDSTGCGCGWHGTMRGDDFISATHRYILADNFFLQIEDEDIVSIAGQKRPQSFVGDIYLSRTPRTVIYANPDFGMGTFRTKAEIGLLLPANAYAGSYKGGFVVVAISSP